MMIQKAIRIKLTPEVRSADTAKSIGGIVFSAFERDGVEQCLDKDGNLQVDVIIGEKDDKTN